MSRIKTIYKYFTERQLPIYWKFLFEKCPSCGYTIFIKMADQPMHTRCIRCRSNLINLSIIPFLKKQLRSNPKSSFFELSTYGATYKYLKKKKAQAIFSEFYKGKNPGEMIGKIRNEDVTNLSFEKESFDIITSCHVFEHVHDLEKAFRECHRVLKPKSQLIFNVPLFKTEKTEKIASLRNGKIFFHHEPEFHHSRKVGLKSSPVFYHISANDICEILLTCGFTESKIHDVNILKNQSKPVQVIVAQKK